MTRRWFSVARAISGAALVVMVAVGSARAADVPALPADARLEPVRAPLEKMLARAANDGLPADLIAGKVREGLAKGVAPEAIRAVAERLATSLGDAANFLRANRPAAGGGAAAPASRSLIQMVAEAEMSGVDHDSLLPLVSSKDGDAVVAHAIAVVTDLTMRGYPSRRSGVVVKEVADRDARALGRIVAGVEAIRVEQTVSRADALEALGRNMVTGGSSLDVAVARALEGGDRAGNAADSASPGKSAEAPGHTGNTGPGRAKKPKK